MKKTLIICICIILSFVSITSVIIGADIDHIKNCHKTNCYICNIINNSISFLKNIYYFFMAAIYIKILTLLVYKIEKTVLKNNLTTLYNFKVQFNE